MSTRTATSSTASAQALDDGGVGHAATLAHGLEAPPATGALELVEQRGHEAATRATEWVAEGDRAAVHVHLLHVRVVLLLPRQDDGGERLVDLDQVHLVDGHARALEHLGGGRDRTGEHHHRVDTR